MGETDRDSQTMQLHITIVIKEVILTVTNIMKIWILLMKSNATITPSLNSLHVGQMSCGDQVVNSMSEIHVPVSVDNNLDVNKNSSGHMLNNNTTHISKQSNDHDDEENSDDQSDTYEDSDGDDTVSYSKFKPTGRNNDFVKIVMNFRQCEKQSFLRRLVKDGKITEITIGTSDGSLTVIDRNNANKSDYEDCKW